MQEGHDASLPLHYDFHALILHVPPPASLGFFNKFSFNFNDFFSG
jgi:hypothetical protein